MPATDLQGSFLKRISIRRNQIASMEDHDYLTNHEDIDLFQKNISERFTQLLTTKNSLLSIAWLRNLLDVFLSCEAELKAILIMGPPKPPLYRLIPELLDRAVKSLDICNAVMHGVDCMRHAQKFAETAVHALSRRPFCHGHVRRANRALTSMLVLLTMEDKEGGGKSAERSWSFGRRGGGSGSSGKEKFVHVRPVTWSVSKSWSASKQIHAMSCNLAVPRGAEAAGMAMPVYMMSSVTVFVMWAMVAALPCQERNGLSCHFPMWKQYAWAQPMICLHERIGEEWKKKEKKGTAGLLDEMQRMEKLGQSLFEFTDRFQFPVEEERMEEVTAQVGELAEICRRMEEGLFPLQMQIREVFHRIVKSRAEFLDAWEQARKSSATY